MGIDFRREGHIALVGLNVPETYNALSTSLLCDLCDIWDTCQNDPEVRVVVIYSALEKMFCAGMDINDSIPLLTGQRPLVTEQEKFLYDEATEFAGFAKSLLKKRTLVKPIIAAINGLCLTGGFELAQACDIRFGTADSKYCAKETQLGIQPMSGGNINLPLIIGNGRAMEMNLTGDVYPASTMLEWGFLNKVSPNKETLMKDVMEFANKLAANGPMSQRGIVRLNKEQRGLTLNEAYKREVEIALPVFRGGDPDEGIQAMREKRKPVYKN